MQRNIELECIKVSSEKNFPERYKSSLLKRVSETSADLEVQLMQFITAMEFKVITKMPYKGKKYLNYSNLPYI